MKRRKWRPCTVAECPNLTLNSRCDDHRYARPQGRRWTRLRKAVLREQPRCRLKLPGCTTWSVEVDHIVPLFEGGDPWEWSNLQGVCRECHYKKSSEERRRTSVYENEE